MPHVEPPSSDRTAEWLASVAEPALRELDELLLVDLLAIERRHPGADVVASLAREYLRTAPRADAERFRRRCADRGIQLPAVDSPAEPGQDAERRVATRSSASRPPASDLGASYVAAIADATALWDTADKLGAPNPVIARRVIADLTAAVREHRDEMIALSMRTTVSEEWDYTFTHMVNVCILTMAQALALGIDGPQLEDVGVAALLHDIGKVRTPTDILEKPQRLTDAEFQVMMRHTIEGAEMLRAMPEMPTLAAVVAFEHHLRFDGSGYPEGVRRERLNVCTQMCSIADVFDAMRSQRTYQKSHPREQILDVLSSGREFDPALVRRFAALIDIHPSSPRMDIS